MRSQSIRWVWALPFLALASGCTDVKAKQAEVVEAIEHRNVALKLPVRVAQGTWMPAEATEPTKLVEQAIRDAVTDAEGVKIVDLKPVRLVPPSQFFYSAEVTPKGGSAQDVTIVARGPFKFDREGPARKWVRTQNEWKIEGVYAHGAGWNAEKITKGEPKQDKLPKASVEGHPPGNRSLGTAN